MPAWIDQIAVLYMGASIIASILVSFIPTPQEIEWRPYVITYYCLQRLSVVRRPWANGRHGGQQG